MADSSSIAHRANLEKSKFLVAAGHDLRQPLHAIGLGLSALDEFHSTPESQEIAAIIRQSIAEMSDLLDSLLDVSRFDSGSVTVAPRAFPLDDIIERLIATSTLEAGEKGIRLHYQQCDAIVFTDAALLERVLANLVDNAIRFTDSGRITISTMVHADALRISVADTGSGIPASSISTIFDQYTQLDNGVARSGKGVGLGLAIVKHICDLLGFELQVHSRPGQGSTFTVEVPVTAGANLERSAEIPESPIQSQLAGQLLIIEDNELVANTTMAAFESEPIRCHHARNLDEAAAAIGNGLRPDVLITDFHLPGSNGVDAIDKVRAMLDLPIPAIITTGNINAAKTEMGPLTDCQAFQKPISIGRLKAGLKAALESIEHASHLTK